ncbi:MAG: Flp pilus assembly protein CpaB [Caldilineales bacterium]|nr:Flp pilus assembly protein CpaB [Caldilineales bacterium]
MKRSSTIWWIAAIIFALLAGVITYQTLSTAMPATAQVSEEGTQPVVVALSAIPFRRSIGENEIAIRQYPPHVIPAGAATSIDQVVGKMSRRQISVGEVILVDDLVTPDIVTRQLALSVPKSKVVMAVPITSMLLSNRLVSPGDRIDLIGSFDLRLQDSAGTVIGESIAALQNLEVHAIILPSTVINAEGEAAKAPADTGTFSGLDAKEQAVLLAVDIQDALVLRHILDFGGVLDLTLRAPDDETLTQTVPVDGGYLINRYRINIP